jgi:hypothetical protein
MDATALWMKVVRSVLQVRAIAIKRCHAGLEN